MNRVVCSVDGVDLLNDDGDEIQGVSAICGECGHETESYGTSEASVRRCLALLREECPMGARNFYVAEGDES